MMTRHKAITVEFIQDNAVTYRATKAPDKPLTVLVVRGAKIQIYAEGVKVGATKSAQTTQPRLKKQASDLLIESDTGETLVVLQGFYTEPDAFLTGQGWQYASNVGLSQTDEGVYATLLESNHTAASMATSQTAGLGGMVAVNAGAGLSLGGLVLAGTAALASAGGGKGGGGDKQAIDTMPPDTPT
ncbi:MAG: hypothetical protein EB125_13115, partial [Betaproteobacteria bacterium]|nr:hypothetical protein [Betaproteobacteria bacterium]